MDAAAIREKDHSPLPRLLSRGQAQIDSWTLVQNNFTTLGGNNAVYPSLDSFCVGNKRPEALARKRISHQGF
jgi:hypothetical protein